MYNEKKISSSDFEACVVMYMSLNFGYIFMKASFGNDVTNLDVDKYIDESIKIFAKGI